MFCHNPFKMQFLEANNTNSKDPAPCEGWTSEAVNTRHH